MTAKARFAASNASSPGFTGGRRSRRCWSSARSTPARSSGVTSSASPSRPASRPGSFEAMSYGTLALVVAIGLLGPLLALLPSRIAPPVVIGEIVAGVIFGRTGTRTIVAIQPTLAFLADIGFALLMFIVATNLPLRDTRLRGAARRGALVAGITVVLAIAVSPFLAAATGL